MLRDIDITFVVASHWLAKLIEASHAKGHRIEVITNGLDMSVFSPTDSRFREKYDLSDKHIVLGVTFAWGVKKGLDAFCELARRLNDDYKIVLVGTNDNIDKQLPESVLSIHKTNNQKELAEIYSAADVFVNPTREETFGMTNIEALACGTPVITFDAGGSPETIDETCGKAVPVNDIDELEAQIRDCCEQNRYSSNACVERAAQFSVASSFQRYIDLYIDLNHAED